MIQKIILLFLLVLIVICYFNLRYEGFKDNVYDYIIKSENDFKAITYNIKKFIKLKNNLGNALKFDGLRSHLQIVGINSKTVTISFIINFIDLARKNGLITIIKDDDNYLEICVDNFNLIGELNVNNKKFTLKNDYPLNTEDYFHVSVMLSKSIFSIFVNGKIVSTKIKSDLMINNLNIGKDKYSLPDNYLNAFIGQINVYKNIKGKTHLCPLHNMCIDPPVIIEKKDGKDVVVCPKTSPACEFIPHGGKKIECIKSCISLDGCGVTQCYDSCNKCDDIDTCKWLNRDIDMCKFSPYGSSKTDCINKCVSTNNCDYMGCLDICSNCTNRDICPWINKEEEKPPEEPTDLIKPKDLNDPDGKPSAPYIKVLVLDNKIKIDWNKPYQGETQIEAYITLLYKTFNKSEGVKINVVPFFNCDNCVHVIDNLDKNETYTIGIRAYNSKGLGAISNLITFKPKINIKKTAYKEPDPPINLPEQKYLFCK